MHKFEPWFCVPALILPAMVSAPAFAVQYLNLEQAQKALFPNADQFVSAATTLSPEQRRAIETASGVKVRVNEVKAWRAKQGAKAEGWFVLDEVIGKHELITYAVAIALDGSVEGVEILDYREGHGGAVRNANWRAQFKGKKAGSPLQLDDDIKNLSGATLSCRHLTEGVRRVLATQAVALK
jgi:Na+-translocating ferredoxin:NAD+ oxidoreductase RnfG subunit